MTNTVKNQCIWGQCGRTASWQIGMKIWALRTPMAERHDKNCLEMLTSVTVCDDCKHNVKIEDFLIPEGKERIANGLVKAGAAEPDFDNAQLRFEEIIDEPINVLDVAKPGDDVIEV